ncbi:MAG: toll/interleukin-1 receptor domain-containing protein [Hymenobacter sp.]
MPTARTSVFISYSHADTQWLRLLNTHLKPLTRDQKVEIWSDQKIRKGERWRDRIHKQLAMARVGIFLVSADFLASDFIHAEELPPLLKAAEKEGATLLTVIVRPCTGAFQDSPLSQLQAMNGPHAPLSGMSKTQREQVMDSLYSELRGLFRAPAAPARKPAAKQKPPAAAAPKAAPTKASTAAPKTPKRISSCRC